MEEESGASVPASLREAASCCAIGFVSDSVFKLWQHYLKLQRLRNRVTVPPRRGPAAHTTPEILGQLNHVTADNNKTRKSDREELWSHLLLQVNNMLAVCTSRRRKKEREEEEQREGVQALS